MSIGKLFHIIHMTGDLPETEAWYDDVLGVRRGFLDHNYMEGEKRDASLVVFGDAVIEPLAPAFRVEGWDVMPLGRFYNRFGNHWHSIAWYTDDAGELWQRCVDNNIRVYVEGGVLTSERPAPNSAIMTHPKDTITQLEFYNPNGGQMEQMDPRLNGTLDPNWWVDNHPLKTTGLAYATILTRDLDRAVHVYSSVLGGEVLDYSSSSLTGTDDVYVSLGGAVIQFSTPNSDGTIAAADLEKNGEVAHAATFRVQDLDATQDYLTSKGVLTVARDDSTLITDPATTQGVPFRWTVAGMAGATHS